MRIKKTNANRSITLGVLGKIKTGIKKINGDKEYPVSTDHFVFTSNVPKRVKDLRDLLGDKPTEIPVTFHSNSIDDVCSQFFELRNNAGQLVAKGDGETFKQSVANGWIDITKDDAYKLPGKISSSKFKAAWVETLVLKVIILGYPELGCWEYRTKAKETSIPQIISSFDTVLENAGQVKMVPFILTVKKHKSNRAEAKRVYPVVNLIFNMSTEMMEKINQLGQGVSGLLTAEKINSVKQIEAPNNEIEDAQIIRD